MGRSRWRISCGRGTITKEEEGRAWAGLGGGSAAVGGRLTKRRWRETRPAKADAEPRSRDPYLIEISETTTPTSSA